MKDAVIEIAGTNVSLTLHPSAEKAEKHAIAMASECTSGSEGEIRTHLRQGGGHSEGDYAVLLATAREIF